MIQFDRVTTEEVIRRAIREDRNTAGTILLADNTDKLEFRYTITHKDVSAKYAKEILKEYIRENSNY